MNRRAKWICAPIDTEQAGTAFVRSFEIKKEIMKKMEEIDINNMENKQLDIQIEKRIIE